MKKLLFISAFLFAALAAPLCSDAGNISLTWQGNSRTEYIEVRLQSSSVLYSLRIRQQEDGRFVIQAPPFPVVDMDGRLRLGELRPAGTLALMLDPFSGSGGSPSFRKISDPSFHPSLSGLSFSLGGSEIFSFSPVFNPESPSGFGAAGTYGDFFAGFLYASQNPLRAASYRQPYQISWSRSGLGRHTLYTAAGFDTRFSLPRLDVRAMAFLRTSRDPYFGGGSTTGWLVEIRHEKAAASVSRRMGDRGSDIRSVAQTDNPSDEFSFTLSSPSTSAISMSAAYTSTLYGQPVYGGESQRRTIVFETRFRFGSSSLKASHSTVFEIDRAKVSSTDYSLTVKDGKLLPDIELDANLLVNRGSFGVSVSGSLTLRTPGAVLKMKDGKTSLEISWEKIRDNCTLRISMDQDRIIRARLTFSGI